MSKFGILGLAGVHYAWLPLQCAYAGLVHLRIFKSSLGSLILGDHCLGSFFFFSMAQVFVSHSIAVESGVVGAPGCLPARQAFPKQLLENATTSWCAVLTHSITQIVACGNTSIRPWAAALASSCGGTCVSVGVRLLGVLVQASSCRLSPALLLGVPLLRTVEVLALRQPAV